MIWMLLAGAAVSAPLDLELTCQGQYEDLEKSFALTNSNGQTGSVIVNTRVMKPGTTRVSLQGSAGRITLPDGAVRTMENISSDETTITGSYRRLGVFTWQMKIDRLTGGISLRSGRDTAFDGSCTVVQANAQPKF